MRRSIKRPYQNKLANARDYLAIGRRLFRQHAWADAFETLMLADRVYPLEVDDLELLATSAYLIGREADYLQTLERAHHVLLEADERVRAARCAFWIGLCLLFQGAAGPATGWFGRAQRLLDCDGRACAERGYLLMAHAEQALSRSEPLVAYTSAARAVELGECFKDMDLVACARHLQGRALLQQGKVEHGLALLDEAMVAVIAGEVSPLMTGLVYCSVIESCMQVYALSRARDWTLALTGWCKSQAQLVAFTSTCLIHHAEILELQGKWSDAAEEAQRACLTANRQIALRPPAAAFYRWGELSRQQGDFATAEKAYREASRGGLDPQPGLALMRLTQGHTEAANTAIHRALGATSDRHARARLLPACVEILLETGEIGKASSACREMEEIAGSVDIGALSAMAVHARGSVMLYEGDFALALTMLRRSFEFWQRAQVPYPAARARELMGLACRALGDVEAAGLELEAAKSVFQQLGAIPDLHRMATRTKVIPASKRHPLTKRELQVLRLIADGKTNRIIAAELFLSQRTIDRHVSNLFSKIDVSTRAAATTYAHVHKLI